VGSRASLNQSEHDGKERIPTPVRNKILAVQSAAIHFTARAMSDVQSQHIERVNSMGSNTGESQTK
jgi:hypothetical protein